MMMMSRIERVACLVYDRVARDDPADCLEEMDFDLIPMMSSLLVSSPVDSRISHQHALQRCIDHAKLWLSKSEQQIDSNSDVTYADVRELLRKMMASDYFKKAPQKEAPAVQATAALAVDDLLSLIYFGSLFDVKSESELESMMRTRKNERDCCLAYDRVADDAAADFLEERDLDLIAMMSSLLISGFLAPTTSHQQVLQRCIDHAKLWLSKSEQRIDSNSDVTYADVREKLTKIMASDYFKEASDKQKDQQEAENSIEIPVHEEPIEPQTEDNKEQQVHRRPYQNQRGGGRSGVGGGGRRGYSNGRGGRSGSRGRQGRT
ncbi:hypothetical protein L2E82_38619 [Cichorium intybus]|uniref:Uncharacterized protein n=1 Tax=Cichorium intybus TaxID=13427 RepID=A0ACB9AHY8_CICIN|nr:hypothetical protein L2E82_38619 [Cichorium intybus]